jgi:hypothetical protein
MGGGKRVRALLKYFTLVTCVISVVVTLIYLFYLPEALDPQGRGDNGCFTVALPSIPNNNGLVASGHNRICDDYVHFSDTYVYLRHVDGKDDRGSLIFRYTDDSLSGPLVIRWLSRSVLSVSIDGVMQITKLVSYSNGVRIVYSVGREKYSQDQWVSYVRDLKLIAVGAIVVDVILFILYRRLSSSLHRKRHAWNA